MIQCSHFIKPIANIEVKYSLYVHLKTHEFSLIVDDSTDQ